ncbi:hypothetical protein NKF06_02110 [Haloferax sp. AB510]|uniref:hypothetical protein n=1 Tax=Haloferax sp. AB510 TaxID=2934172 RepID=UPI00209C2201|nr:hypothetical protein [Haloferax sp. AB510]MCO8265411.1 hypothetical protein [Haloferax sp. AB510]
MAMTDNSLHSKKQKRRTFLKTGSATAIGLTGLAGCLTGGTDTSSETEETTAAGTDETGTNTTESGDLDFGGKEIDVMLNVGSLATVHKKYLIPHVEEKYNLKINTETGATTSQLTKLQANEDSPPDVFNLDVIGVDKASRNEWLEPLSDHTDIVTNLSDIDEKFVHYGSDGVSWEVGAFVPVINTNQWDSTPSSHSSVATDSSATALTPFSWSNGPNLLLMASAVATGEPFDSQLDVEPGFQWLEENLKPKVSTIIQGVSSANQQLASGNVDTVNLYTDFLVYEMWKSGAPIEPLFRLEPTTCAFAETISVSRNSENKEAALVYANEALSPWFQEKVSAEMGAGVTNTKASLAPEAEEFGAITPDEFDQLSYPDFEYVWNNRSDWAKRWNQIFSG